MPSEPKPSVNYTTDQAGLWSSFWPTSRPARTADSYGRVGNEPGDWNGSPSRRVRSAGMTQRWRTGQEPVFDKQGTHLSCPLEADQDLAVMGRPDTWPRRKTRRR
jgi:hypothetical protein